MLDLALSPYTAARLTPADAPALQQLCARCGDYFVLEDGAPARPDTGEQILAAVPPGKTLADKHVIGVRAPGGELAGVLDLVRDFPAAGEWLLGLLLLDPDARSAGLGSRVVSGVAGALAGTGAMRIQLWVLEQNEAAERFWRRHGFTELRRQPFTSRSGHESRIIVMSRSLA